MVVLRRICHWPLALLETESNVPSPAFESQHSISIRNPWLNIIHTSGNRQVIKPHEKRVRYKSESAYIMICTRGKLNQWPGRTNQRLSIQQQVRMNQHSRQSRQGPNQSWSSSQHHSHHENRCQSRVDSCLLALIQLWALPLIPI